MFLHDWEHGGLNAMMADFYISEKEIQGAEILLASYTYEDYSGSAFVLFRREGKWFEVNGSHCSCYGLENQWEPEEVRPRELYHRITKGTFGFGEFSDPLLSLLKEHPSVRLDSLFTP